MSNTPERIWYNGTTQHARELRLQAPTSDLHPQHEYIRADLHDALRAENERYREAMTRAMDSLRRSPHQNTETIQTMTHLFLALETKGEKNE